MSTSSSIDTSGSERTLIYGIQKKSKQKFIPLSKRECIALGALVIALLIVLILIIRCATMQKFDSIKENVNNQNHQLCTTGPCLKISSFIMNNMNKDINPCDDFYKYVCDNFSVLYPARKTEVNFFTLIGDENKPRFHDMLLEDPPLSRKYPESAEWKMKLFYRSCLYGYQTVKNGGQPLLEILDDVGGWHVLNTWNQSKFDLDKLFKQVQIKYWSPVIFDVTYITDPKNKSNSLLKLSKIFHTPEHHEDFFLQKEKFYRRFAEVIAFMLIRDGKLEFTQKEISQNVNGFLDDLLSFLGKLSKSIQPSQGSENVLYEATVDQMQRHSPIVNWKEFLHLKTGDLNINENTKIYSADLNYFRKIDRIFQETSTRTLQNFFIWIILEEYTQDLSFDYIYESYFYKTKVYRSSSRPYDQKEHCFNLVKTHMGDVLRHTFVSKFIGNQVKTEVKSLVEKINSHGVNTIAEYSPQHTREDRKRFLTNRIQDRKMLGATKPLLDIRDMDLYYFDFEIKEKDYFHNRLQLNKLHRLNFVSRSKDFEDNQPYLGDVYLDYDIKKNRWYIPEEILQFPMFDKKYPQYLKFGGIGYIISMLNNFDLLEAVRKNDQELTEKLLKIGNHISATLPQKLELNLDDFPTSQKASSTNNLALSYAYSYTAIRHLYKVYKHWVNENGKEGLLPGLELTMPDQLLFLFMTATRCSSDSLESDTSLAYKQVTPNVRLKSILQTVPEFVSAFNCPTDQLLKVDLF